MTEPHALSHEVSVYMCIYILIWNYHPSLRFSKVSLVTIEVENFQPIPSVHVLLSGSHCCYLEINENISSGAK